MWPPLPSFFSSQELWAQVPSQFLSINRPGTGHICEGFSQSVKSIKVGRYLHPHCEWEQNLPMAFQIRGTLRKKRFCLALGWQLALPCWHLLVSPSFVAGRGLLWPSNGDCRWVALQGCCRPPGLNRASQGCWLHVPCSYTSIAAPFSVLLTCFFCMRPFKSWSVSEQCGSCLHCVFSQPEPFQKLAGDDTLC